MVVEKEGCGLLVEPDDTESLAEAIIQLRNRPQLREEMAERGKAAIIDRYNWSDASRELIDVIKGFDEKEQQFTS